MITSNIRRSNTETEECPSYELRRSFPLPISSALIRSLSLNRVFVFNVLFSLKCLFKMLISFNSLISGVSCFHCVVLNAANTWALLTTNMRVQRPTSRFQPRLCAILAADSSTSRRAVVTAAVKPLAECVQGNLTTYEQPLRIVNSRS